MTFNDEVACRKKIGINVTGAVQASTLLDILGRLEDKELMVRENEKGELEFKGAMKGFGVTKDAEIFLPIDRVEIPKKWKPLPKEFLEGIGQVQHCVSTDESRFLLTCIHIHPEYIEACDNHQVMRFRVDTGMEESLLVRGTSIAPVVQLGMEEVSLTKAWIHFRNSRGLVFSARRHTEEYPSLEDVMKVKGKAITLPKGLKDASDRASVFATDKSGEPSVVVNLSNGVIRVKGVGLTGWYREVKEVVYEGPSMEFIISPELLKLVCEKYQSAIIGDGKLKATGGNWDYVTVLGSTEEDEDEAPKKKKAKQGAGE